jgi:hypothetical protein
MPYRTSRGITGATAPNSSGDRPPGRMRPRAEAGVDGSQSQSRLSPSTSVYPDPPGHSRFTDGRESSQSTIKPLCEFHGEERAALDRGREIGRKILTSAARRDGDKKLANAAGRWLGDSRGKVAGTKVCWLAPRFG